jgi:hypothetical protein
MEAAELIEALAGMTVQLDGAALWHAIQRHEGTG